MTALLAGTALGVWIAPRTNLFFWESATPVPTASSALSATPSLIPDATAEPTPTPIAEPATTEEWIDRYIEGMTTTEKLGQLVIFGFSGTTDITDAFREVDQTYQVGNLVLYGSNIKNSNSDAVLRNAKDAQSQDGLTRSTALCIDWKAAGGAFRRNPRLFRALAVAEEMRYAPSISHHRATDLRGLPRPRARLTFPKPHGPSETRIITRTLDYRASQSILGGLHSSGCLPRQSIFRHGAQAGSHL